MSWTDIETEILRHAFTFYQAVSGETQIPRGAIRTILRGYHGQIAACWRPTRISPRAAAQMVAGGFSAKSLNGLTRDHFTTVASMLDGLLDRTDKASFEEFTKAWWNSGEVAIVAKGEGTRRSGVRTYQLDACTPIAWSRDWTPAGSMTVPASIGARNAYRVAVDQSQQNRKTFQ